MIEDCPNCISTKYVTVRCEFHSKPESDCMKTMKEYVEKDLCFVCRQPREVCRGNQLTFKDFEEKEE